MRIRSTKPEFWRSERIASVDWDARLVLKGLESYVDDNGVGKDDLALIVADVFPRDLSRNPPGTLQKVSEAISHLENAGLVWRYEANGTRLIFVSFWESVQRIEKPTRGRFPRPDGTWNYRDSNIREFSRNVPGILPEPSGQEQGNRGTGEQVKPPVVPHDDDTPVEEAKPRARKRAARALPDDWQPNDAHLALARERGVDPQTELANFRDHAKANDRRQVDWDASFRTWLRKATPGNVRRIPAQTRISPMDEWMYNR